MPSRDHEQNSRDRSSDVPEESQTDNEASEAHDAVDGPMSDEQLAEILSTKRIRSGTYQRWGPGCLYKTPPTMLVNK